MAASIKSSTSRAGGTATDAWAGVDEEELLRKAADCFRQRDEVENMLRLIDREIRSITTEYSRKTSTWGFTPLMLRKEARMRGLA